MSEVTTLPLPVHEWADLPPDRRQSLIERRATALKMAGLQ